MPPKKSSKPKESDNKSTAKRRRIPPRLRRIIRFASYTFWIIPLAMVAGFYFFILKDLPSPTKLGSNEVPLATKIYDRNGTLLFDIFAEQNRTNISLEDIPLYVQQATIAIEDKNFYQHQGINPIGGVLRAAIVTLQGDQLQGGSTITQQLVKSALLTPERTITRKIREMLLAIVVEIIYSKNDILEMYLNQVPYGGTAWGIQAAAQKYFNKDAKDLTLAQGALLAGLPQAPSLYSPFGSRPDLAKVRQESVLRRMVEDGYITQEEADAAAAEELEFIQTTDIKAPHFVMYVKELLVNTYGQRIVEQGGLQVTTTLDLPLQEYAQATVSAEIEELSSYRVGNGAALITKPATGEILAMVGSRDYFATPSGSFNVTTALRQPGSSIKPINFAIGIEKKIVTPSTVFLDVPTCFPSPGQPNYCPVNYDGRFHGLTQLRFALANSYNIPAVKMLKLNTVEDMIASASAFGIDTYTDPSRYGLSLTLGGGEVHMTDMAEAFGVFANGGIRKDLVAILKVVDRNGKVLEEYNDPNLQREIPSQLQIRGERAGSEETAFLISHILSDNGARVSAFGPNSALVVPGHTVSVKTGTTDDLRDNWTIGYTPQYLVATWVGNNDNSPMNQSLVSGVTGAAPIWNALISHVLEDKPDVLPKQPDGVVGARVCSSTGVLPSGNPNEPGCGTRFEYFIKGTIPARLPVTKQAVLIDKTTGEVRPAGTTENVEPQERDVITDGISVWCIDCPFPSSSAPSPESQ